MSIRKYKLYNYVLKTDIEFDMLREISFQEELGQELFLFVNQPKFEEPEYILHFEEDIVYYFFSKKNAIFVETSDINNLYSSFFNIPMSIYALLKNSVLIHCNGLIFNGSLFCFSGNKGLGKTTLALHMMKYGQLFSDDCIAFAIENDNVLGYNASQIIKTCEDTFNIIYKNENYSDYYDTFSKKAHKKFDLVPNNSIEVKKIFFLNRSIKNNFEVKEINSEIIKKMLITQSIVGTDYFHKELLEGFKNSKILQLIIDNVRFFELYIPCLTKYKDECENLYQIIVP